MDITLGDAGWALGIVAGATILGIAITVFRAVGGGAALGSAARAITWRRLPTVKHYPPHPRTVMSRRAPEQAPERPVARHVDEPVKTTLPGIAAPGNVVNDRLTDQRADLLDGNARDDISEARKIIQYRERLATLADLINAGVTAQAEGIEKAFGCTRSGRKDSRYAQVRADLLPLLKGSEAPVVITPIAGRATNAAFQSEEEPA